MSAALPLPEKATVRVQRWIEFVESPQQRAHPTGHFTGTVGGERDAHGYVSGA